MTTDEVPTILLRNNCTEVDVPLDFPHREAAVESFRKMGMKVRLHGKIVLCPICLRRANGQSAVI